MTQFFAKVAAAYRRSGFNAAVALVQEQYPDLTPRQAHDMTRDIIFEFVN